MYGSKWRNSRKIYNVQDSTSFAIMDDNSLRDREAYFTKERKLSNDLWISRTAIQKSGWLTPVNNPDSVSHRFAANLLDSKVDFGTVKGWLDFCATNHVETCTLSNPRPLLGLKVIDCEKGSIVEAAPDCDYLALSYVWGSSTSSDQSTREGINLLDGNAPSLVKDAIGLSGVESKSRSPSVTIKIGEELYAYVPPDPGREILQSSWNSRGWTHQETILSRRRIFFCSNQ
jgi:hypothetical protein